MSEPNLFEEWLDEVFRNCPDIKPRGGYMKNKYLIDNTSSFYKWLDRKKESQRKYAFTLTTNCDLSDCKVVEEKMIYALSKIMTQQTCPVLDGEGFLEYTEAGRPHIHGWYRCDKGHRIYQKIWKRYWPEWNEGIPAGSGHKGGYHREMKSETYVKYASAEGRKLISMKPEICNVE